MNFTPNFEQFKKDEEKLEKIPTIKPEFYFVINDICQKILNNQGLSDKEKDDLEMVFDMTQNIEKELIVTLNRYRSRNLITEIEFLLTADYFLTANQNGPESDKLKKPFMDISIKLEDFKNISKDISMPEDIRKLLQIIYSKIIVLK